MFPTTWADVQFYAQVLYFYLITQPRRWRAIWNGEK